MLLLLFAIFAGMNVAAAATLNVSAGKLTAMDAPVDRCYSSVEFIPVTRGGNVVAVVGRGVDPACNGDIVTATLRDSSGTLLSTSVPSIPVGQPSFTVPFPPSPQVALSSVSSVWLTIKGFPLNRVFPLPSYAISMNDWTQAYNATVTATNNTSTLLPWGLSLAIDRAPLNGTPCATAGWGDATTSFSDGVLTATPIASAATVGGSNPTRSFTFCMERSAPPPAEDDLIVTAFDMLSNWGTGYNAEITIEAPNTFEPTPWVLDFDFSEYEHGIPGSVDSVWIPGKTAPSYSYSAPILTLTAVSTQHWISAFEPVQVRFGVSGVTYPDPDPDPDPDPGDPPTFTATVASPATHGGTSYTGSVTVTTNSTTAVPWQVILDAPAAYGVPAGVTVSGATLDDYAAPTMTVSGASVSASSPVTFTYAATGVAQVMPTGSGNSPGTTFSSTGGGQCNNASQRRSVTVTSTTPDWHPWQVVITPNLTGNLTIENANGTWDGTTLTAWGTASNWAIKSGTTRTFQYCIR